MIRRSKDDTYYVTCDSPCCCNDLILEAKNFSDATKEATVKGFALKRGVVGWVNFCTKFCETCYNAPMITIPKIIDEEADTYGN